MGYYDTTKGVNEYIRMAEGYDGAALINVLETFLPLGSSVLELGMGPGKDLDLLLKKYDATGSDSSEIFVQRYAERHPGAEVLTLDALSLDIERRFDAIYSNKVLQHFTPDLLATSLAAQHQILNPNGIALHSLWYGDVYEEFGDMISQQYTQESFANCLQGKFTIIHSFLYLEMEKDDSLCLVLKRET